MNSRRRIDPPKETPHRCQEPSTLGDARVRTGQIIDARRCGPMSAWGQNRVPHPESAARPELDTTCWKTHLRQRLTETEQIAVGVLAASSGRARISLRSGEAASRRPKAAVPERRLAQLRAAARTSEGAAPKRRRNSRLNVDRSPKPTS